MRSMVQYIIKWNRTRNDSRPCNLEEVLTRYYGKSSEERCIKVKNFNNYGVSAGLFSYASFTDDHFACSPGAFVITSGIPQEASGNLLTAGDILKKCPDFTSLKKYIPVLNGGFTLAAFFFKENVFAVARDRFGLIPVYYSIGEEFISVGTGPMAVAQVSGMIRANIPFLTRYILYRYDEVAGHESTFLQNTFLVPPATICSLGREVEKQRYWSFENLDIPPWSGDEPLAEMGLQLLLESTKETVFSPDKPDGGKAIIALSGGMDSSSVAAACHKIGRPLPAFTAAYDMDVPVNEFEDAKEIADKVCTSWVPVVISREEFLDTWSKAYRLHDFPLATSSYTGYDILSQKVANLGYERIVMGGSGDDLFAGNYPCFLHNLADLFVKKSPFFEQELESWIRLHASKQYPKNARVFWDFLMSQVDVEELGAINPKPRVLEGRFSRGAALIEGFTSAPLIRMNAGSYLNSLMGYGYWFSMKQPGLLPLSEAGWYYGMEFLDPFLKDKFFEFGWKLPPEKKIKGGIHKVMLRCMVGSLLPERTIKRTDKVGFDVPFEQWAGHSAYREFLGDIMRTREAQEIDSIVDIDALRGACVDASYGSVNPMFLWQVANAILWLRSLREKSAESTV